MKESKSKCCGECCWFYGEMTDGEGFCPFRFGEMPRCDEACRKPSEFVSREDMRHHQAVLMWYNRWRAKPTTSEKNYCPIEFEEISNAIDFASEYIKVFSKL